MTATAPEAVTRGRELVTEGLRAALERLHPRLGHVAAYHRGWVDADGTPRAGSGGKALRPALALLSAEAAGAPDEVGLPGAVAVELVHDFSLLHDDLMDGDVERRHRPTAWTVFGAGNAILAGDALLALAGQVLLDVPGEPGRRAAALLADTVQELVRGQAEDIGFETRLDVTLDAGLDMIAGKTGALLSCSAAIGAVLAGAEPAVVDGLAAYGARLGLAFQLVDDLLGIWGDPEVTGKPVLSDLRSRKKSVPVVRALGAGGEAAAQLRAFLAADTAPAEDELVRVAALVEAAGGREWTSDEVDRQLAECDAGLADLSLVGGVSPQVVAELRSVARFVGRRES